MDRSLRMVLFLAALLVVTGNACWGEEEPQPAADAPASPADTEPAPPAPEKDLFQVPEGTAEELLAYLDELLAARPSITTFQEYLGFQKKRAEALLETTTRILAADAKLLDEDVETVIGLRLSALSQLAQMGDERAVELLYALPKELQDAGYDAFVRPTQQVIFQDRLAKLPSEAKDEFIDLAEEVKRFIVEAKDDISRTEIALAMVTARESERIAEATEDETLAVRIYQDFARLLSAKEDPMARAYAERFEGTARRLDLIGKPIEVKGFTVGGEPFDMKTLKDKVVLLDFWATWCAPCRAEIPKLLALYESYHDKGFEIVAVSLDQDLSALAAFLEDQKLPWIVLPDHQPERPEHKSLAIAYGVSAIPTMILVGRDGKVLSTNARGAKLEESLQSILGPAEPSRDDAPSQEASEAAEAETPAAE